MIWIERETRRETDITPYSDDRKMAELVENHRAVSRKNPVGFNGDFNDEVCKRKQGSKGWSKAEQRA